MNVISLSLTELW